MVSLYSPSIAISVISNMQQIVEIFYKQYIFRDNNCAHNDFYGFRSQKRFAKSYLSNCLRLLCIYFFHVHFFYSSAGIELKFEIYQATFSPHSLAWFTTLPSWALENITWKNWKMKFVEKKNSGGKGKISENLLLLTLLQRR